MTLRPLFPGSIFPWAIAAGLAFAAVWLAQRYHSSRTEAALLHSQREFLDVALQSARQQLETERLLGSHAVVALNSDVAAGTEKLAAAERALSEARERIATLNSDPESQSALAALKITTLASMVNQSSEALAIAVWDPARQEGILQAEKLPALAADEDYQLWIVDPQYPNPVDGGVFAVDPRTGKASLHFKPRQPIRAISAFTVTRERKGGVARAEGPVVLTRALEP